jgi:hypothetical protein
MTYPAYGANEGPFPDWPKGSTQEANVDGADYTNAGSCQLEIGLFQPANPPATPVKNKKLAQREKNYSHKEDEVLCSGYLNVSKDAIVGANQSGEGY